MNMIHPQLPVIPAEATHHEMSVSGFVAYYRADTQPHQSWNGLAWSDLGEFADVTTWATPIDQELQFKSKNKHYLTMSSSQVEIYSNSRYKGD